jgi:hypothetical protein
MEQFMKDTFKAYSDSLSEEEFQKRWSSLDTEHKKAFGRASLMYLQASKCRSCDSDVCITLLCSAVETVADGKNVIFKDWLVANKPSELANKNEKQVAESLNKAYEEYLQSKTEREGIAYDFRKFLHAYCPDGLKNPPIKIYKGTGTPFDIALRGLYSRFRSLFLHEGIGYASIADRPLIDKETGETVEMIAIPFLAKVDNKYVSFELTKLTDWFSQVVKASLMEYLARQK